MLNKKTAIIHINFSFYIIDIYSWESICRDFFIDFFHMITIFYWNRKNTAR